MDELRAMPFIDIDRPIDRTGEIFNRVLLRLVQASPYVKQPLKNLARWHREHGRH